ncbi:hypothetical protein DSM107003_38270 [Trichormus variabilis SAG 1403-4b]|uniref:Uncharacterized protein n=1 Tax=Trichormus variabilis SAG 1403-4b TaxID=447716 RepID=A0A3S1CL23_ANAVA|nr:hypothetical protein DSM107003_38270 [Trichormus variabilis SAG 1403-4b]
MWAFIAGDAQDTETRGWGDGEMGRRGDAGKIKNYLSPVPCSLFTNYELRITNYELFSDGGGDKDFPNKLDLLAY